MIGRLSKDKILILKYFISTSQEFSPDTSGKIARTKWYRPELFLMEYISMYKYLVTFI